MKSRIFVYAFVLLTAIYLSAAFLLPPDPATLERYQITQLQSKIIYLAIIIPLVLIWMIALYGFLNLRNYALAVKGTKEGKAFRLISIGLMLLVFSLPLNSIMSTIFRYLTVVDKDWIIPAYTTKNYITLLLSLAAFSLLYSGASMLVKTFSQKKSWKGSFMPSNFGPLLVTLSAVYAWLITSQPINHGSNAYYLPGWLLIFTIVVPYLIAWKSGMLATYYLYQYHTDVKGSVYKKAFADIAIGIGIVVIVSIAIQLISTSSAQFVRFDLTPLLLVVYLLLIVYAIGFGFVANGAKKLKRIEEV